MEQLPTKKQILLRIFFNFRALFVKGNKTYIKPFKLSQILPKDVDEFFRYEGSMTYPDCHQNTIWTVFKVSHNMRYLSHVMSMTGTEFLFLI